LVLAVVGLVIALIVQRRKYKALEGKLTKEQSTNSSQAASYKSQIATLKSSLEAAEKKNRSVVGAAKDFAREAVTKASPAAKIAASPAAKSSPAPVRKAASTPRPQSSSYRPSVSRSSGSRSSSYNDGSDLAMGIAMGAALSSSYSDSSYGSSSSSYSDSSSSSSSSSYDSGSSSSGGGWE
jgi:hypothetical protein